MCGCDMKNSNESKMEALKIVANSMMDDFAEFNGNMSMLLDRISEDEDLIECAKFINEQMGSKFMAYATILNDFK